MITLKLNQKRCSLHLSSYLFNPSFSWAHAARAKFIPSQGKRHSNLFKFSTVRYTTFFFFTSFSVNAAIAASLP